MYIPLGMSVKLLILNHLDCLGGVILHFCNKTLVIWLYVVKRKKISDLYV